MNDQQIQYLPFHAINEFMVPEYRHTVLQTVFGSLNDLPADQRGSLIGLFRRQVQIPGFRNATLAPIGLKVKAASQPFDQNPAFAAQVLSAWAEMKSELRQLVFDFLAGRGWEMLPVDADRTQLPGFQTRWPKGESFEALDKAFREAHPDHEVSDDDLNLMVVWLAGRLPYEQEEDEEEAQAEEDQVKAKRSKTKK
jgi:hypothetical protein